VTGREKRLLQFVYASDAHLVVLEGYLTRPFIQMIAGWGHSGIPIEPGSIRLLHD